MDEDAVNPNILCNVCGENEFEQREGFYYCLECGTKQEQVRQVEVENADAFNETTGMKRQAKTIKIKVNSTDKQPQLTSWECYNYILRGFVDELMTIGAKEELKLMALQVWAAYLRRNEVAFFSKKYAELPKLGVRYIENDAATIYNHSIKARKNRRRRREDSGTSGGEDVSSKNWRKSKRKLDESLYSSLTSATSASHGSTSTGSGLTNRAIKLNFNMKARRYLKKKMSVTHMSRHELDSEGLLQCHNQPRVSDIGRTHNRLTVMSIKQIYAILGIALNLIEDDIQLCDLVRFIYEGHIGWKNVLMYFPENIASHVKDLLKKINFYSYPEKYREKMMREHINLLCSSLNIHSFKMPNMTALVQRYVNELCLPPEIVTYAERLINFLPPSCAERTKYILPKYEARAMAYIVFILKQLFGLDGEKEHRMSRSAQKLNAEIRNLNAQNGENRPLLFVWEEWVQYIEMRKIIVSQYNPEFRRQFKQCERPEQIMEEMSRNKRRREEEDVTQTAENRRYKSEFETFRSLLNIMIEQEPNASESKPTFVMDFKATFTPALSYFKTILMQFDNASHSSSSIKIPEFMRVDHSERDIHSYVEVKPIVEYFQKHKRQLKVYRLDTTENRKFVGVYRFFRPGNSTVTQQPNFHVTEEEWLENAQKNVVSATDNLSWKTVYDIYDEKTYKERLYVKLRRARLNCKTEQKEVSIEPNPADNNNQSLSIEVFNEYNMNPLNDAPTEPRRYLDKFNIFEGIDDENSLIESASDEIGSDLNQSSKQTSSAADNSCDISTGIFIKSEFIEESPIKTPTEEEKTFKFYISNMDCWMILGFSANLNKTQRTELLDKFPAIFKWLIETCAQTLGIKWINVYEQLLTIEIMFGMGVKDLDKVENCVYLNTLNYNKDFQSLIKSYKDIW